MSQLSTFWIGSYLFGIDVGVVQEIVRVQSITPVPLAAPWIAGLINRRGQVLTALDLRIWWGLEAGESLNAHDAVSIVVRVGDEPISLLVDAIDAVVEVSGLRIEQPPSTLDESLRGLILGVYLLPDRLLLALDVPGVLDQA